MYSFCPCSCSKPDGENEEDVLICLPRNLSYAGESYLDRYSVSSAYVHNAKLEKQLLNADLQEKYARTGASAAACAELLDLQRGHDKEGEDKVDDVDSDSDVLDVRAMANSHSEASYSEMFMESSVDTGERTMASAITPNVTLATSSPVSVPHSSDSKMAGYTRPLTVTIDSNQTHEQEFSRYVRQCVESPDSDMVSEEGIFVNMIDDLDGLDTANGKSEASDDTCVSGDSMYYSPEELDNDADDINISLEHAVQRVTRLQASNQLPMFHLSSSPPEDAPHFCDDNIGSKVLGDSDNPDCKSAADPCQIPNDTEESSELSAIERVLAALGVVEVTDSHTDKKPCIVEHDNGGVHSVQQPAGETGKSKEATQIEKVNSDLKITVKERPLHSDDKGPLSGSYRDLLSPDSPVYEDREFNFPRAELRKSTSLKSTKTPPGTPRRKKAVRFADALGLDLESVRHILNLESPPKIPPSAMKDLQTGLSVERRLMGTRHIVETFPQPGADMAFRERVLGQKVSLENALVVSGCITGVVRVANIAFHKAVRVRFTVNDWTTFHDIAASYMLNSNDGATDRFSFTISPPPEFGPGGKLQFAINYNVGGVEYWDSNGGGNYVFECFAKTVPTETENAWMHFL